MPDAILSHRSVTKGELTLLEDIIVSGSAVTQVDISGLSIGKGEEILLVINLVATVSNSLYLYINGNNTTTNYYAQSLTALGTSVTTSRVNEADVGGIASGSMELDYVNIKLTNNGYIVWQSHRTISLGTIDLSARGTYATSTFTATSITSIRLAHLSANGIGIGSRFTLYKVGG